MPNIILQTQGVNQDQAAELRAALACFKDWDKPEMDVYDDYDSALDVQGVDLNISAEEIVEFIHEGRKQF